MINKIQFEDTPICKVFIDKGHSSLMGKTVFHLEFKDQEQKNLPKQGEVIAIERRKGISVFTIIELVGLDAENNIMVKIDSL